MRARAWRYTRSGRMVRKRNAAYAPPAAIDAVEKPVAKPMTPTVVKLMCMNVEVTYITAEEQITLARNCFKC